MGTKNDPKYLADLLDGEPAEGWVERFVDLRELHRTKGLMDALTAWVENNEGMPSNPNDADLLKALWTFEGDKAEPCPECDGDCGEPCAPCTVEAAHRMLDQFSAEWRKRHGIVQFPVTASSKSPQA